MSTTKQYIGVAPLTMVRTDPGGYVNVLAGDPVPENIEKDDLKRLVDEGFLAEIKAPKEESSSDDSGSSKPAKVDDILAVVGDDKEKAKAALDAEHASDKPRTSLVGKLEAILAAEPEA